ncbi:MAG: hypothetical protein IJJ80_01085 [Clostridia bacterium]|nr:hypothetical protein [Clostridia bacterium]
MTRFQKICMMSIGYIVLFISMTFLVSLLRSQPYHFEFYEVAAGIICAVATEFAPRPKKTK